LGYSVIRNVIPFIFCVSFSIVKQEIVLKNVLWGSEAKGTRQMAGTFREKMLWIVTVILGSWAPGLAWHLLWPWVSD
jgi:hypothetical protein